MKRFVAGIVVGVLITLAGAAVAAPAVIKLVVNGQELPCQPAPRLIGGSVFVPVRFVSEALGARVQWQSETNSVVITTTPPPQMASRDLRGQTKGDVISKEGIIMQHEWISLRDLAQKGLPITANIPRSIYDEEGAVATIETANGSIRVRAEQGRTLVNIRDLQAAGLLDISGSPATKTYSIGNAISFPGADITVNAVSYDKRHGGFVASGEDGVFAIIDLTVTVKQLPKNKIDWSALDFVQSWRINTGQLISGSQFATGTSMHVRANEKQQVQVALPIKKNMTIEAIVVKDPLTPLALAEVKLQ